MPFPHVAHAPALPVAFALVAALAPPLRAHLAVEAAPGWLGPGESAVLEARWTGTGSLPTLAWSLPFENGGRLKPAANGSCLYYAPDWLPRPRLVRVRAAWTESGAARHQDTILQVHSGWSGSAEVMAYVPHLPGTDLHERWLVADRAGGRILILDGKGRAEPWLGDLDPGAPARDGRGREARFLDPAALAVRPVQEGQEAAWEVLIVDRGAHAIRRADAKGEVTTLAGALGQAGHRDGSAAEARFDRPGGAAYCPGGEVFVTDTGNHCIRRIGSSGVATVAGRPGSPGRRDDQGASAELLAPGALCLDPESRLLFFGDGPSIRTLDPEGRVRTVAGGADPCGPDGPAQESKAEGLERWAGIPCLGDPAALGVAGPDLRIYDRGLGRVLNLRIRGEGLGRLTAEDSGPAEAKDSVPDQPAASVHGFQAVAERAGLLKLIAEAERKGAAAAPALDLSPVPESPETRLPSTPGSPAADSSPAITLPESRWVLLARTMPQAPRPEQPVRSRSWSADSSSAGPAQPALPRRNSLDTAPPVKPRKRWVPVRDPRNRADLVSALDLFAGVPFPTAFHQAIYRHARDESYNDHLTREAGPVTGRFKVLLERHGVRGLDGKFFLSLPSVCALAGWMLRNADLANTPEDLEGWRRDGCPDLPAFPFGLYISDQAAGKHNRIVLEVQDFRKLRMELEGRPGVADHKAALQELEAGGFVTGFSALPGQPLYPTRGLRLVLFEGGQRIATCHPLGPSANPWFQPRQAKPVD